MEIHGSLPQASLLLPSCVHELKVVRHETARFPPPSHLSKRPPEPASAMGSLVFPSYSAWLEQAGSASLGHYCVINNSIRSLDGIGLGAFHLYFTSEHTTACARRHEGGAGRMADAPRGSGVIKDEQDKKKRQDVRPVGRLYIAKMLTGHDFSEISS